jgi:hypothetical protein
MKKFPEIYPHSQIHMKWIIVWHYLKNENKNNFRHVVKRGNFGGKSREISHRVSLSFYVLKFFVPYPHIFGGFAKTTEEQLSFFFSHQ